jgi:hypothetical protein
MENLDFTQAIPTIAKQIRKEDETWNSALSRAATLKHAAKNNTNIIVSDYPSRRNHRLSLRRG